MRKAEFLDKLCQELRFHTDAEEIRKVVSFYEQSIDDRMEDGMSEEDAVAALGPIDDIVREIREVWSQEAAGRRTQSGGQEETETFCRDFDPAVTGRIEFYDLPADIFLSPSPDRLIHLEVQSNGSGGCQVSGGSTVTVRHMYIPRGKERLYFDVFGVKFSLPQVDLNGLTGKRALVKLQLPAGAPVEVTVKSPNGGLTAEQVTLGSLSVKLANGAVCLRGVEAAGPLDAATANGDMSLENAAAPDMVLSAANGDVTLHAIRSESVRLNIASGDAQISALRCAALSVKTASGDVDAQAVEVREKLAAMAVSGDLSLKLSCPCPLVELNTTSGDVDLTLSGPESLYSVSARVCAGRARVAGNAANGPDVVRIKSLSGDVNVSFGE